MSQREGEPATEVGESVGPPQPLEVAAVDDLDALAFAVTEAIPQVVLYRRVGVDARLGASLFDGLLFGVGISILAMLVFGLGVSHWLPRILSLTDSEYSALSYLGCMFLWIAYTATEILYDGTPGKLLIGKRIGSTAFMVATLRQKVIRWVLRRLPDISWVTTLALAIAIGLQKLPRSYSIFVSVGFSVTGTAVVWLLTSFAFAFTRKKLALHDILSGTAVIEDYDAKPISGGAFDVVAKDKSDSE